MYDHQRKVANQRIRKVKMEILFIGNSPFNPDDINLDSGAIFLIGWETAQTSSLKQIEYTIP